MGFWGLNRVCVPPRGSLATVAIVISPPQQTGEHRKVLSFFRFYPISTHFPAVSLEHLKVKSFNCWHTLRRVLQSCRRVRIRAKREGETGENGEMTPSGGRNVLSLFRYFPASSHFQDVSLCQRKAKSFS